MPKPKIHFLVCGNKRPAGHPKGSCADRGATETINAFSRKLQETQKYDTVKVSVTSCLGPCGMGPVVAVYPDDLWYGMVDAGKADEIWNSHVNEGKALEKYLIPEGSY